MDSAPITRVRFDWHATCVSEWWSVCSPAGCSNRPFVVCGVGNGSSRFVPIFVLLHHPRCDGARHDVVHPN